MTIAVSVVVKPSRIFKAIVTALCACTAAVGVVIGIGLVGEAALAARLISTLAVIALALESFLYLRRLQGSYALDISGTGQIRLNPHLLLADQGDNNNIRPHSHGMLVTLLPDSTLWQNFIMLRLQDGAGRVHTLSIWPDSLSQESFRSLAVACRWIAAHRFAE